MSPISHMVNIDYLGWPRAPQFLSSRTFQGVRDYLPGVGAKVSALMGHSQASLQADALAPLAWHAGIHWGHVPCPLYGEHLACTNSLNTELHPLATINPAVQL